MPGSSRAAALAVISMTKSLGSAQVTTSAPDQIHRNCRICGEAKPLTEFYADNNGPNGFKTSCKPCHRAATGKHSAERLKKRQEAAVAAMRSAGLPGGIWRPTLDSASYEVSDHGRVRRAAPGPGTMPGKILNPSPDHHGYPSVWLMERGKRIPRKVHKLVADAFLGPKPSPLHEVAHWDNDRSNPRLSNLRWATKKENHADKLRHGTSNRGERHGLARLTADGIRQAVANIANGSTIRNQAERLGVHRETLGKALRGESWAWLAK
jgi:hypothetical protein